jgi:hypothetical protein
MRIKNCRNCKNPKFVKLFSLGNQSFTGKFTPKKIKVKKGLLELIMCSKCNLIQLAHNYDLNYMYGPDYGYRTGMNKTMTNHVSNVSKSLSNKVNLSKNDIVLDIASNDGTLLNSYKKKSFRFAIDPLVNKYKDNYKKINFKVSAFFSLNEIVKKTNRKFKIITALAVFYDLKDPNKFLREIELILEKDGVLFIEVADLLSMLKYNMFDAICHEHLIYYTSKIILEMTKKNNLRVFDIKFNDINGGSTQYYICKKNAKYINNDLKLKKVLKNEKKFKLDKKNTYQKFILKIKKIRVKIVQLILNAKKRNEKIHGYGASTKGNVLLQYFNLNKNHIDFIADRNPKKFNLYTPGTKIKIVSEKFSRKIKPDYYLVLPWHFKKEILKREQKTIKNGSKFIFPLPFPKVHK